MTAALLACMLAAGAYAQETTLFDFTKGTHGWTGNPRVANLESTPDGLAFDTTGVDPWIETGPVEALPKGERVLLTLRMKSTADRSAEVFYAGLEPGQSRQFIVEPDGAWHEYSVLLPPQPEGARLRIDPAHGEGHIVISSIQAQVLSPITELEFAPAARPAIPEEGAPTLTSGDMTLVHNARQWNGFIVLGAGREMAAGHTGARIVYQGPDGPVELDNASWQFAFRPLTAHGDLYEARATMQDPGGATWTLMRTFRAIPGAGAIDVITTLEVDQPRDVLHLPALTLLAGLGTYGERKTQAVLPGVEYLADEPSSSEADVAGEAADRRIVQDHKIAYPLMAIAHRGSYVGVVWRRDEGPAVVFDSPDRVYGSKAHLMALWYPAVGENRLENELNVYQPMPLEANRVYTFHATLIAGAGDTVVPAMKSYAALRGTPEVPVIEGGFGHAVELLAAGWLDSDCRVDGAWRHAVWQGRFPPVPAADAPAYMRWLAAHTKDAALAARLEEAAEQGLRQLPPDTAYESGVSHVRRPTPPLLFGNIRAYMDRSVGQAWELADDFDEDGVLPYTAAPDKPDYARTHWARHANGYAAASLERILDAAAFTGDEELEARALWLLDRQLELYKDTVPRGAQTWEMPLHTPDILASARMIRCCVLGYQLTGAERYLENARYWADTGLAFIYLDQPVPGDVGTYATTSVFGATNWVAPYWVGLPVQWCGLVYAAALSDLAEAETQDAGLWRTLANGITASGLEQTFPLSDEARQGLLPDFFHLREQVSDGPAINPGTVQANLAPLYGKTPWHQAKRVDALDAVIHAPGAVDAVAVQGGALSFRVDAWPQTAYRVHITNIPQKPEQVTFETERRGVQGQMTYDPKWRTVTILLEGSGVVKVEGVQ